jgi:hypothetical protein
MGEAAHERLLHVYEFFGSSYSFKRFQVLTTTFSFPAVRFFDLQFPSSIRSFFTNITMSLLIPALLFTALPGALGLDVPANVRQFYNDVKAKGKCDNKLSSGFYNDEFGGPGVLTRLKDQTTPYLTPYI